MYCFHIWALPKQLQSSPPSPLSSGHHRGLFWTQSFHICLWTLPPHPPLPFFSFPTFTYYTLSLNVIPIFTIAHALQSEQLQMQFSEFSERSVLISTLATSLAYTAANIFSEVRKAKEVNFGLCRLSFIKHDEGATFTGPIFVL